MTILSRRRALRISLGAIPLFIKLAANGAGFRPALKLAQVIHTNQNKVDPGGTERIRKRYVREMGRRFARMRALIRESLLKNKALELPRQIHGGEVRIMAGFPAGPGRFAGPADIAAAAFSGWLREQSTDVILGVAVQGTPGQPRRQWQRAISGQSYLNGLKQAAIAGARLGLPNVPDPAALFELPRHQEAWRVISQRQYQLLQGVSFDMADDLRTVLGEGLRGGLSVDEITKNLVDRVSKLEATRARSIAVTETTFANAEATLNALQDMGIQQVTAMVAFVTTSGRPCPLCTALEGQIFTIEEARRLQLIPQHPSCVCQFLPVPVEQRRKAA